MKWFLLISIFCCSELLSQDKDLQFNFFDPKTKLYVIGENHFEDNTILQPTIINYLIQNSRLNTVIVEMPVEAGKIFNEYVQSGIKAKEVDVLCSLLQKHGRRNLKAILETVRQYNVSIPDSLKIKVKGIDLFSYEGFFRQVQALTVIFPEFQNQKLAIVNRYLFADRNFHFNKETSKAIVDSLFSDIAKNREQYTEILGDRLKIYQEHLIQMQYDYLENSVQNWKRYDSLREKYMTDQLIDILNTDQICVMICGAVHAMYLPNDSWYNGYPFTSITATAMMKYPDQVFAIILQYHRKKIHLLFGPFNLLNYPMKHYFENSSSKYVVIESDNFGNSNASQRCNLIVIKKGRRG